MIKTGCMKLSNHVLTGPRYQSASPKDLLAGKETETLTSWGQTDLQVFCIGPQAACSVRSSLYRAEEWGVGGTDQRRNPNPAANSGGRHSRLCGPKPAGPSWLPSPRACDRRSPTTLQKAPDLGGQERRRRHLTGLVRQEPALHSSVCRSSAVRSFNFKLSTLLTRPSTPSSDWLAEHTLRARISCYRPAEFSRTTVEQGILGFVVLC